MKKITLFILLIFTVATANAQHKKTDTLLVKLQKANTDTTKLIALLALANHYYLSFPDSSIIYGQWAYEIAEKKKWDSQVSRSLNNLANAYATMGDYVKGMQFYFKALRVNERINNVYGIVTEENNIGATYIQKQDYKNALPYLWIAKSKMENFALSHKLKFNETRLRNIILLNLGESYLYLQRPDSAKYYLGACYLDAKKYGLTDEIGSIERDLGEVESSKNNNAAALKYFLEAVSAATKNEDGENLSIAYLSIATYYHKTKQQDSAEYYAQKAIAVAGAGNFQQDVINAGKVLYTFYDEDHNLAEAYKYYKITTQAKDSIYSQDKVKQLLSIDFDEKQRRQEIAEAQQQYQNTVRTYILIAGLGILLLLVVIFWRNGKHRQKANRLLRIQKEDIQSALSKLESTKDQLIQSEKMASLGELTAGIAHEIQNPLNFINNFSEINKEMIDEMEEKLKAGSVKEALEIALDIKLNEEKINHHGKRADGIVKGMLQHSRASSNTKEITDINKLADEYLRLAYHGNRAKDKSFNAELVTSFADNLPQIYTVPQDIGRALLNLFNNAFYVTQQKQKAMPAGYKPTVEVSTATSGGFVLITIKDNGLGIPEAIKEKIMQPFFTTKPTGEGTGLGLSLSYDIVVKGHGGEITIDTKENEFTAFTIKLPLNNGAKL